MGKLHVAILLIFISNLTFASVYKIHMQGINAWIDQGNGNIKIDDVNFESGPLGTTFDNLDYDLKTRDKKLIISSPGQEVRLDLGNFNKIFEEQVFNLTSAQADIETGKRMSVAAGELSFALEEGLQTFKNVFVECSQPQTRGIGEEVIALCLTKGKVLSSEISVGEDLKKTLQNLMPREIEEEVKKEAQENAINLKSLSPKLRDLDLSIADKKYDLKILLKFIFKFRLNILGTVKHEPSEELITVHIASAKWWKISFKKLLLKQLKKMEADGFKVEGDKLLIDLALMNG